MPRRILIFCGFAAAAAIVFVRLGLWQIDRLHERRTLNATIEQQQRGAPLPLVNLPADTARAHYRAASVDGVYDYDHEIVLSNRTRRGSPGVDLLTPVRMAGRDTAVLVNRGWVYSPNGASVDHARVPRHGERGVCGDQLDVALQPCRPAFTPPRLID